MIKWAEKEEQKQFECRSNFAATEKQYFCLQTNTERRFHFVNAKEENK